MRKVAFLVANDKFPEDPSIPSLRFPQNDANDLAEILGDKETCGFETRPCLNESSQSVLGAFEETSQELAKDDMILFYYSGHGILRGKELCLASIETKRARRGSTSIEAKKVLEFLKESNANRRVFILDCCFSGAIGTPFKGGDAEDALNALAHSSGICILTASTAIQLAKEREKEEHTDRKKGNGVFTKALIDCLREPSKEHITVDDLYQYAFQRLGGSSQTPKKLGEQEGLPIEIGNFKKKLDRLAKQEREQLILEARIKLNILASVDVLSEKEVGWWINLLESGENLSLRNRQSRDDLIRYLKGGLDFWDLFGKATIIEPREQEVVPATKPTKVDPPITPPGHGTSVGIIGKGGHGEGANKIDEPTKPKILGGAGTMPVPKYDIFISYRRLDSSIFSEALAAQLQATFGRNRVFIDTESIRDADVWASRVEGALRQAKVVIVVIGKSWLSLSDKNERRLIDLPDDWVRREIETSLKEGMKILPVLIDGAQLPTREALPTSIAKLIDNQARIIDIGRGGITRHIADLVNEIGVLLNTKPITNEISYPFPMLQIDPLDDDNLTRLMVRLPSWQVVTKSSAKGEEIALKRMYMFESFLDAIHFMNTASRYIDLKDHHPEWTNIWRTVVVHLTTWDIIRKPSRLDADVATYLDGLYEHYERKISQHDVREPTLNVDEGRDQAR